MRRFELIEGTSDKFWEIDDTVDQLGFTVRYGRRGTNGQIQTKTFDTAAKAGTERDKLIAAFNRHEETRTRRTLHWDRETVDDE